MTPTIEDDAAGLISIMHDGKPLRWWVYNVHADHRRETRLAYARAYVDGWIDCAKGALA